uniref:Uncharacterized protein n=1 Tax=Arundo donax TaxID=35708 RepID=A0A0A9E819_ARUDO
MHFTVQRKKKECKPLSPNLYNTDKHRSSKRKTKPHYKEKQKSTSRSKLLIPTRCRFTAPPSPLLCKCNAIFIFSRRAS